MAVSEQQQQINMNKFLEAQEHARKLISNDARQEKISGKVKMASTPSLSQSLAMGGGQGYGAIQESYSNDYDDYEANEPQYLTEEQMMQMHQKAMQQPIRQDTVKNSKLPSAILEAFKENPIDTSVLEKNMGMESDKSVLDLFNVPNPPKKQKQVIRETPIPQQTVSQQPAMVDYSLIRTIVEESVKKYVSALKKSVLNENKQQNSDNLVLMKIGESFKFVTSNGDIFEAKLVKKGNVNEKKVKE